MNLDEYVKRDAQRKLSERAADQAKVLTIDIETSPTVVYTFDMRPNWISPDKIIETSEVMCWAAKWYHEDEVQFFSNHHDGHETMIRRAWEMLDEADVLVTFNGVRFDVKHLKREFVLAGFPPPSPWKDVDLYREAKKQWEFESKGLNHLAQRFELGAKQEHEGFGLWKSCLAHDAQAWNRMRDYNVQDVVLTERVYDRMRGWMPGHPHLGPIDAAGEGLFCNQCGGTNLKRDGLKRAVVIDYVLWRCDDCGGSVQGTMHSRAATTRGAR